MKREDGSAVAAIRALMASRQASMPAGGESPPRQRGLEDMAGRGDARGHGLLFAIVAARVAQALRRAQLHRQSPATAGDQPLRARGSSSYQARRGLPRSAGRLRGIGIDHEFKRVRRGRARAIDDAPIQRMRLADHATGTAGAGHGRHAGLANAKPNSGRRAAPIARGSP